MEHVGRSAGFDPAPTPRYPQKLFWENFFLAFDDAIGVAHHKAIKGDTKALCWNRQKENGLEMERSQKGDENSLLSVGTDGGGYTK